jgi:hypothetical protein
MFFFYARWAHVVAAWLFVAGVVVQAFLAGVALTQLGGNGNFEAHRSFGYSVMGILALVVLVAAVVGRMPRAQVGLSVALLVLYIVQTSLPYARADAPLVAALHPATAMLLLVLGLFIAWRAGRPTSAARART